MNHRQLNLHNIIKQQQAKISQLKEQLRLVTQLSQSHLIDTEKRTLDAVKEKQEIIRYLREELDVERVKSREAMQQVVDIQDTRTKNSQLQQQAKLLQQHNKSLLQQSHKLTQRNTQLQTRIQQLTESYQKKLALMQRQNKRLANQSSTSTNQNKLIQSQIDKLTKFYKSCIFEIPKRKETLLWVDNLIKYMEVWEQSSEKKYQELYMSVKEKIGQLKMECMRTVGESVVMEEKLCAQAERVCAQMIKVLQQHRQSQKLIFTNIQQLHKLQKKQKQSTQKNELQQLRTQLINKQAHHRQQQTKLQTRIKQLQQEKKTLVLGFQQIKTFLENKQTNYKQEIGQLKQTINELLEGSEMREREFEDEIKMLSAQIQAISNRYYENIEYPVLKMNERVEKELGKVKAQLNKLGQEYVFREQLELLSQRLRKFTHSVQQQQEFVAIELCMKKSNELLISIRQLVTQMGQKKSEKRSSMSRKRQLSVQSVSGGGGQKRKGHDGTIMKTQANNNANKVLNEVKEGMMRSSGNKRGSQQRRQSKSVHNSGGIRYSVVREQRVENNSSSIKRGDNNNATQRKRSLDKQQLSSSGSKKKHQLESIRSKHMADKKQLTFQDSQPLFAPLSSQNQSQQHQFYLQDMQYKQQIQQLQHAVSQIQLKERQNKYIYQINLLKKHNHKLSQHIVLLQKKFKNLAANKFIDQKVIGNYFKVQRRMIEVDSENDKLRETNQRYEMLFREELQKVYKRMSQMQKQRKQQTKQQSSILQALGQLNERHQIIAQILSARNQKIKQLQTNTQMINKLLIKPQETFEMMIKQFTAQLSTLTVLNNQQTQRTFNGGQFSSIAFSNVEYKSRLSINEGVIREYQEVLNRRGEINAGVGRYIVELIKTLRETFPVRENKKRETINSEGNNIGDKENVMNKGKLATKQSSLFDKKLKQLTTQQQKNKLQITSKIDKIQQTLMSIDARQQKSYKLSQTREKRIEQLLEKYITQIVDEVKYAIDKEKREQQGLNIQALKDTAGKLKQSVRENEGLKREMDVMYLIGRGAGGNGSKQQYVMGRNLQGENNFYQ